MAAKKKSTRKYSKITSENVKTEMHEMKRGTLRSGRSGKVVTNPKQAIAIGLSEARRAGKKVPKKDSSSPKPKKTSGSPTRSAAKKRATHGRKRARA
jgi:hypothetical protein